MSSQMEHLPDGETIDNRAAGPSRSKLEMRSVSNRRAPEFASLAHEFRTPLNAIIGFSGTLLMKLAGPITADQERQLRIIQASARELASLVTRVMDGGDTSTQPAISPNPNSIDDEQLQIISSTTIKPSRVLFIDDDPNSRKLLGFLLTSFGHVPFAAESGEKGIELARLEMPDLILCDVQMLGINGYEVARQLKLDPKLCNIPLVAITAEASLYKHPMEAFDSSIAKPIDPEKLAALLNLLLVKGPIGVTEKVIDGCDEHAVTGGDATKSKICLQY